MMAAIGLVVEGAALVAGLLDEDQRFGRNYLLDNRVVVEACHGSELVVRSSLSVLAYTVVKVSFQG